MKPTPPLPASASRSPFPRVAALPSPDSAGRDWPPQTEQSSDNLDLLEPDDYQDSTVVMPSSHIMAVAQPRPHDERGSRPFASSSGYQQAIPAASIAEPYAQSARSYTMAFHPHGANLQLREPPRIARVVAAAMVAVVLVASGGYLAVRAKRQRAVLAEATAKITDADHRPRVEVGAIEETAAGRQINLAGEVRAYRQATLYAKMSGYVRSVRVDKGDRVKKNDVLGVLEAPEVEQQAASTRADLALKRVTAQRAQTLAPSGAVSQQELDQSRAQVNQLNADLARLEAMRGYSVIRAPFDGVITARYADPGALLQAATGSTQNALPLVDVADIDRVRIAIYLGQSEAMFVREGDDVQVWNESKPDEKVSAKVTRFGRSLDPRTRTMLTEVEVANPKHAFYPGAFVRVRLRLATPPSLIMPATAVVFKDGMNQVAVVQNGAVHFVPVEVDSPDGKSVRVVKGVDKNATVVLHPGDDVLEGIKVHPVQRPKSS